MLATVTRIHNLLEPSQGQETFLLTQPLTVAAWLEAQGLTVFPLPTLCLYRSEPLLRAQWATTVIQAGDQVIFVTLPQGKWWKGFMRTVLSVAAIAVAPMAGGLLAGSLGVTSTIGTSLLTAGVALGGATLTNLLIPPPKPSFPLVYSGYSRGPRALAADSLSSLAPQGNQARLGSPIPVIYGRHKVWPDFAALPYTLYQDNEQVLYQLHCVGQGHYEVESLCFGETPLSSFEEVEYAIIPPNAPLTLFDARISSCVDVCGQELPAPNEERRKTTVGPFFSSPPGTQVTALGLDIVLPRGLYYANNAGGLDVKTVRWRVEARCITDEGEPQGEWLKIADENLSAATVTPQRRSYHYPVSPGRYEVRVTRTDHKDTSPRAGHELRWDGLKASLERASEFKDITLLAVKLRATETLAQTAARHLNCIVTRKLPTWHPSTGWSELIPTRSIAWALMDVARAQYGAKLSDHRLDLEGLYSLNQLWHTRGDAFDGVFDHKTTVWEALTSIARCGRAVPYLQAGRLRVVRDTLKEIPVTLFGPRTIVHNSLKVHYLMPNDDTADAVTVSYINPKTWQNDEVTVSLEGSLAEHPAKVTLLGCTDRTHAQREAYYMAACNRYRRQVVSFLCEYEGLILTLGDLIAMNHDVPSWGQAGEIIAVQGNLLTTSEPLRWAESEHVMAFRNQDGSLTSPCRVIRGRAKNQVLLIQPVDIPLYTRLKKERTHYAFGTSKAWAVKARVLAVKPRGDTVEVTAVIDHPAVHREPSMTDV